jgi:hypothetical protein
VRKLRGASEARFQRLLNHKESASELRAAAGPHACPGRGSRYRSLTVAALNSLMNCA